MASVSAFTILMWVLWVSLMCRSHSAGVWISSRENCSVCNYSFCVSMAGDEFRSLLCYYHEWEIPLRSLFCLCQESIISKYPFSSLPYSFTFLFFALMSPFNSQFPPASQSFLFCSIVSFFHSLLLTDIIQDVLTSELCLLIAICLIFLYMSCGRSAVFDFVVHGYIPNTWNNF